MRARTSWTIQSFFLCFLFNGLLGTAIYFMCEEVLGGMKQWLELVLKENGGELSQTARSAWENLTALVTQTSYYLPYALGIVAGLATFLLWLAVGWRGRRGMRRVEREAAAAASAAPEAGKKPARKKPAGEASPEEAPKRYVQPSPGAAVQILALLQRQGRFLDFLQEDLGAYDDAQVGAAVRNIHEGCKAAMAEHVKLEPVFKDEEGSRVEVAPGFDPNAVRLTGDVSGEPPFQGVLRHRGWKVSRMELPRTTGEEKENWVVAPAEVEL